MSLELVSPEKKLCMYGLGIKRTNTLEMMAGNVFNLQHFEQNKIKFKQRSFADFIGTSFILIYADLLLISDMDE